VPGTEQFADSIVDRTLAGDGLLGDIVTRLGQEQRDAAPGPDLAFNEPA
jgi:hypothetical protein